jgi:hypothetical protein
MALPHEHMRRSHASILSHSRQGYQGRRARCSGRKLHVRHREESGVGGELDGAGQYRENPMRHNRNHWLLHSGVFALKASLYTICTRRLRFLILEAKNSMGRNGDERKGTWALSYLDLPCLAGEVASSRFRAAFSRYPCQSLVAGAGHRLL